MFPGQKINMVILGILTCIEVYHCLLCWLNYLSIHFWRFTKISFLQTHSNLALKHSGCCHALFTFKNVTKYFIKKGSKVYCAFLDSSKAFDKVLHNGLFVKLLKKGMSVRFVRIFQNWYSKLCAAIQWNGVTGKVFVIHCGVRQGGILSPMVFCIYMDDLIKELRLAAWFWNILE